MHTDRIHLFNLLRTTGNSPISMSSTAQINNNYCQQVRNAEGNFLSGGTFCRHVDGR